MKPYIAILIDSFWEAVGNKVLWALLIGWTLVLGALAPFGYISESSYRLSTVDIANQRQLIQKLAGGPESVSSPAIQHVRKKLDKDFVDDLREAVADKDYRQIERRQIVEQLNKNVMANELYDEEVFPRAKKRKRLEGLLDRPFEQLAEDEADFLNRELLQLTFPLELRAPQGEQLWVGYAGIKFGSPLPISRQRINQFVEPLILQLIIKFGLGVIAVLVALIVTSNIIPDTFLPGSLHLLLSKPISRVMLFLSRFLGSCIFVTFNIAFVLTGLYFIAGIRFEIWNEGLLACIPVLVFVFMIFYSVSALTGLIWGNAIVSIVCCIIFWGFCFLLSIVEGAMRGPATIQPQIARAVQLGDDVFTVNNRAQLQVWNSEYSVWQPALKNNFGQGGMRLGPVYDAKADLVFSNEYIQVPFGGMQARTRELTYFKLSDDKKEEEGKTEETAEADDAESADLAVKDEEKPSEESVSKESELTNASDARKTPRWDFELGAEVPRQPVDFVALAEGKIFVVCRTGIFKLNSDKLLQAASAPTFKFFGAEQFLPTAAGPFEKAGPSDYFLGSKCTVAATADGKGLIIYNDGNIEHLRLVDGDQFELVTSVKLDGDITAAGSAIYNGQFCVVARASSPLTVMDGALETPQEVSMPADSSVRRIDWIPNSNKAFVLTQDGDLFSLDCASLKLTKWKTKYQGEISSLNWIDESTAWLGVSPNRLYKWNAESDETVEDYVPAASTFENIYNYAVRPLFQINPKPASLDETMLYLLSGKTTMNETPFSDSLESTQVKLQVWQPIVSNLGFIFVVLLIASVYVARKEY